jgi:hypothetical protein
MGAKLYSEVKDRLGEGPDWTEPVDGTWYFVTAMTDE